MTSPLSPRPARRLARIFAAALSLAAAACGSRFDRDATTQAAPLDAPPGAAAGAAAVDLDAPGPIALDTVVSARWTIPLGGLLDLGDPAAKAAGLSNTPTKIVLVVHVVRHPTRGLFVVDTGVTRAWRDGAEPGVEGPAVNALLSGIEPVAPLADIVREHGGGQPLAGVFFTHMHIDHVLGLPEVPADVPLFAGDGELEVDPTSAANVADNALLGSTFARLVAGHDLRRWDFASAPPLGPIAHAIDVFGDGSLFALSVPGHTKGSAAFYARTTDGPVLLTGDCSHTIWGFFHRVAPGVLSEHMDEGRESLRALEAFAAAHPKAKVLVGHETDGVGTGVAAP